MRARPRLLDGPFAGSNADDATTPSGRTIASPDRGAGERCHGLRALIVSSPTFCTIKSSRRALGRSLIVLPLVKFFSGKEGSVRAPRATVRRRLTGTAS